VRLRAAPGVPLGEVYSFLSSLYFRGKLAYAQAFGRPPAGLCKAFVITPGEGRRDPAESVTIDRLRRYGDISIKAGEPRYLGPLRRDAEALRTLAEGCRIVLLGSVASSRYVEPLLDVFGERLFFPPAFVGRGDMSRGGLLLRSVTEKRELAYAPWRAPPATDHGRPGSRDRPADTEPRQTSGPGASRRFCHWAASCPYTTPLTIPVLATTPYTSGADEAGVRTALRWFPRRAAARPRVVVVFRLYRGKAVAARDA